MAFSNPITGGQGALIRPAVKSPNYTAGASGWTINRDGSAEFNNLTIRGTFLGSDFIINSAGIFVYHGTPAANNLIAAVAAIAGTDTFGNQYLAGIASYDTSGDTHPITFTRMLENSIDIGSFNAGVPDTGNVASFNSSAGNAQLVSQPTTALPDSVYLGLISGANAQVTGSATAPHLIVSDLFSTGACDIWLAGTVIATDAANTRLVWQTVANAGVVLGTGWADGGVAGTSQKIQYRKDCFDNLVIVGTVHSTSATPAATIFTTAAGYRPKVQQLGVVNTRVSPTNTVDCCAVTTAGVIALQSAVAVANTDVSFMVTVPLGNIA
jgi:hypothetical protein